QIAMRWHAEGLLERPRKVVWAQMHQFRHGGQRDLFSKMLLDVFAKLSLLPAGESSLHARFDRCSLAHANELAHQGDPLGLDIGALRSARILQSVLQLERRRPDIGIEEKHAWLQLNLREGK